MPVAHSGSALDELVRALDARAREFRCHPSLSCILEGAGGSEERVLDEALRAGDIIHRLKELVRRRERSSCR